jgi:phosphohistidine phosphatase
MKALWLLRHAKSSWDDPSVDDHDRPLAPRGRRDAERVAGYLAQSAPGPSLVLCSSALRTRETWAPISRQLTPCPRVRIERELYLAGAETLLARLARVAAREGPLLVIGHNPGLHELAVRLAVQGEAGELARLRAKLPTAALVRLELDVARWRDLEPGCGRLVELRRPRDPA